MGIAAVYWGVFAALAASDPAAWCDGGSCPPATDEMERSVQAAVAFVGIAAGVVSAGALLLNKRGAWAAGATVAGLGVVVWFATIAT